MFAALHIPDFPMTAALRAWPQGRARPCAILVGQAAGKAEAKLPLLAVNAAAHSTGIAAGWPLNRALVRCPDLRVIGRDPDAECLLRTELVVAAESLGPDLEITTSDLVLVDLSFRSKPVDGELQALALCDAEIRHARAATPDLAGLAVRRPETCGQVVSPEDLRGLPLAVLGSMAGGGLDLSLLDMWGMRTLGDFMKLPRQALAERLGPEAGRWHDVLHGKSCRLLRLHRPPESFAQRYDFDDPVVALEPLVFALKRLLHTLTGRLAARHLAARHLDVRLILDSGDVLGRQLRLPEPQTSVEGMLPPLQAMLESLRLESEIVSLELDAGTTFASAAQREWFGRQLPQPERWAETLARLEAMLGPGRVGIPVPPRSFRPDTGTLHPAAGAALVLPDVEFRPDLSLPLRRYRPPCGIAVAYESQGERPWPLALLSGPHQGRITDRRGPFPSSGSWWEAEKSWQRMEWDVQVERSHLLRLAFQMPDSWQLDGIYG